MCAHLSSHVKARRESRKFKPASMNRAGDLPFGGYAFECILCSVLSFPALSVPKNVEAVSSNTRARILSLVSLYSSRCSDLEESNRDAEGRHPSDVSEASVEKAMVDSVSTMPRAAAPGGSRVETFCSQASVGSTGWRSSLEAVADVAVGAASKATESSADWFRKVGLRDAEDNRSREEGTGPPPSESSDSVGRGVTEAGVEESGQLAMAPAAAAARRWEAKLKGSFVSITSGVRWGMS